MHPTTRRRLAAIVIAGLLLSASCTSEGADGGAGPDPTAVPSTTTTTDPDAATPTADDEEADGAGDATFPGDEWAEVDPADAGFDPAELDALAAEAEAAGSSCLAVVRDGEVVASHAWPGPDQAPREAFSVTKSLTSTLVGIAVDRGDLALDDPASTYLPEWVGTDSDTVTVRDLVANTSGRQWSLGIDYRQLVVAPDRTAFGIGLGQDAPPGQVWAYNNSAIQTLSAVLRAATGEGAEDLAEEAVFDPIGMASSSMSVDGTGQALTFMGLQTTCLDLARFGHLFLNDGSWDGEQVVSADWAEAATNTSSSELNAGYGYLWWLNKRGRIATPALASTGVGTQETSEGQMLPGASEDIFWALGFNQQTVAVIPEEGIVAVRLGAKPPETTPFSYVELTNGVLGALEGS